MQENIPQTGNSSLHIAKDYENQAQAQAQEQQPQRPNKYIYPLFDGFAGERYLKKLLEQILPAALFRTWSHAVDFQKPGNVCYVGAAKIAEIVKPGVRKIEIDLHELEVRRLMYRYTDHIQIPQEDGTVKTQAVTVKDFTPLYDFAYGYHLWINSPEYVPASREHEDYFRSRPQLCEQLIKYDNYRKIFTCQKPGRKPQPKSQPVAYQCQLSQESEDQELRTADPNQPNNYFQKQKNVSSPYRETKKERDLSLNNSISSLDLEEGVLESVAIRNECKGQKQEKTENRQNQRKEEEPNISKSKQNETQQKEENPRETAKEAKEYTIEDLKKNPMAMTAFLLDLYQQQQDTAQKKATFKAPKQETRKRRGTPEQLAQEIMFIVQQLGDNPKSHQSDITRITKIYYAASQMFSPFTSAWFLAQMKKAFFAAAKRGVKKRMPYFFTTLENKLELTLEEKAFIRSDEPLYKGGDIRDFINQMRRSYERSNSPLYYEDWVEQTYLTGKVSNA